MDTAEFITSEWREIVRVMTLVRGGGFEDSLSEEVQIKTQGGEPGRDAMAFFRVGDDLLYTREPSKEIVIEQRSNGTGRGYDRDGKVVLHSAQPLADPDWN